jgi:hypothetical protein
LSETSSASLLMVIVESSDSSDSFHFIGMDRLIFNVVAFNLHEVERASRLRFHRQKRHVVSLDSRLDCAWQGTTLPRKNNQL